MPENHTDGEDGEPVYENKDHYLVELDEHVWVEADDEEEAADELRDWILEKGLENLDVNVIQVER